MPSLARRLVAVAATVVVAAPALTGCGADAGEAALPIQSATGTPDGLVLTTECATDVRVVVHERADDVPTIAMWGKPAVGRCHPTKTVHLRTGTLKIIDAATSQVVDVTPRI